MNVLDIDVLLHVVGYMNMSDITQIRATCKSNRYLFCSYNSVTGQALVNQYGAKESIKVAFKHCHEKVMLWICRNFTDQLNWWEISAEYKLSNAFIREFKDSVHWGLIFAHQKVSEAFIKEFKDVVNWVLISGSQKLSEAFIREFKNKVSWWAISERQELSEDFIREFQDRVNWWRICWCQKLSEAFIREFKHKVSWKEISRSQKLSNLERNLVIDYVSRLSQVYCLYGVSLQLNHLKIRFVSSFYLFLVLWDSVRLAWL